MWSVLTDSLTFFSGSKMTISAGGKLLMTYGWADSILQPMMGVNHYERAVATNGPATTDFFPTVYDPGHGSLCRWRWLRPA
jgi:hypothetical protein